ncbi:MAG: 30S ribosomal protein S5 [Candidatus Omnitrophota bacterium]
MDKKPKKDHKDLPKEKAPLKVKEKLVEVEVLKEVDIEEVLPVELKKAYRQARPEQESVEKVVCINRTTKVTKGGRKLNFGAVVVVGDKKGKVGCGFGKANEVPDAIKKGINEAKKSMIEVSLQGNTIPHEVIGRYGAAVVLLKPAAEGTGVIAGNVIRAICDAVGIKNILTKCLRSQTPVNVIKATLNGLTQLRYKNELLQDVKPEGEK